MLHPILLYTEQTGHNRPAIRVGTLSADEKGRMVFRDNDESILMIFVDIKDSGALDDTLKKANIQLTLPQGNNTL
jgi:hypothetical protein